jgi:hypothetical protein
MTFLNPLLMILNFNEAEIKVEYEYKEYNKQGTQMTLLTIQ